VRLCRLILILRFRRVGFASSSGEIDPPSALLRRLPLIRDFVVHFQPLKCRGFRRIESKFANFFAEEISLFRMVVETACFDFVSPAFNFLWRFLYAGTVEPFYDFLVARSLLDLRLEIVAFHVFETEEHVIERTIEVIFADISRHQGAAFIDGAAKDCVTSDGEARTARGFFL
jgi:hypothetical protein